MTHKDILALSVPERILLAQEIWDSVAREAETLPPTDAQREELDRRLDAVRQAPDRASSWTDVRARLRNRA